MFSSSILWLPIGSQVLYYGDTHRSLSPILEGYLQILKSHAREDPQVLTFYLIGYPQVPKVYPIKIPTSLHDLSIAMIYCYVTKQLVTGSVTNYSVGSMRNLSPFDFHFWKNFFPKVTQYFIIDLTFLALFSCLSTGYFSFCVTHRFRLVIIKKLSRIFRCFVRKSFAN